MVAWKYKTVTKAGAELSVGTVELDMHFCLILEVVVRWPHDDVSRHAF
jgi:hypothetical protein